MMGGVVSRCRRFSCWASRMKENSRDPGHPLRAWVLGETRSDPMSKKKCLDTRARAARVPRMADLLACEVWPTPGTCSKRGHACPYRKSDARPLTTHLRVLLPALCDGRCADDVVSRTCGRLYCGTATAGMRWLLASTPIDEVDRPRCVRKSPHPDESEGSASLLDDKFEKALACLSFAG